MFIDLARRGLLIAYSFYCNIRSKWRKNKFHIETNIAACLDL